MERAQYPSDLTDAEWASLSEWIPKPLPGGRPVAHERREMVNAILYVLRTGCGWASVPHEFPPWSTVYSYFRQWRRMGIWEQANAALTRRSRQQAGRADSPSLAIIDRQSVPTTEKGGAQVLTPSNTLRAVNAR